MEVRVEMDSLRLVVTIRLMDRVIFHMADNQYEIRTTIYQISLLSVMNDDDRVNNSIYFWRMNIY